MNETTIVLPPKGKSTGRKPLYEYALLNVGEFMNVPNGKKKISVINAARNYGRKNNMAFAQRTDANGITTLHRTK